MPRLSNHTCGLAEFRVILVYYIFCFTVLAIKLKSVELNLVYRLMLVLDLTRPTSPTGHHSWWLEETRW